MNPRWLSLKRAALYAAMGKYRLVDLAKEGKIKGFQDPDSKRKDWIFDRLSLDQYRESQVVAPTIHEKALAIMKGERI
jgi:hypothetical protein